MIGSGLRSRSQAVSSIISLGSGCSTNNVLRSASQQISFERPLLIGPSLIGVDTERLVGRRADDLDELAVALDAHFDLDHVVGSRFLDFLPDDLGRVDARS